MLKPKMRPIRFGPGQKTGVSTQFGALCYRVRSDKTQVLLVTSRGSGRWILPKGWPVDGATPHQAALSEAWEEAGVKGKVVGNSLGIYSYLKLKEDADDIPCVVVVFAIKVSSTKSNYPEAEERTRKWFSLKKASERVSDPELRHLILNFDPKAMVAQG